MWFCPTFNFNNVSNTFASWGRGGFGWFSNSLGSLWGNNSFSSWGRYFSPSFSAYSTRSLSYFPSYRFGCSSFGSSSSRSWNLNSSLSRLGGSQTGGTANFTFGTRNFTSTPSVTSSFSLQSAPASLTAVRSVSTGGASTGKVSASYKQRLKDLGPAFLEKVKQISKRINCDYQDLLAVMNAESGLNHTVQNHAGHHYYGLIQFGEDAAKSVGTTTAKLVKMSALEQLDYVEKYFLRQRQTRGWGNQKFSAGDLYALVFAPARAKGQVLYTKAANRKAYNANRTLDQNRNFGNNDGIISKDELNRFMRSKAVDERLFYA